MISDYFLKVRYKLEEINWLIREQNINFDIKFQYVSDEMGIIEGKLVFLDNSILEFRELIDKDTLYKFQYMDKDKNLICRWDTAPHHKEIPSFPYHLHTKRKVEGSRKIDLIGVLDIITEIIIRKL